jgi:hypothetical protein
LYKSQNFLIFNILNCPCTFILRPKYFPKLLFSHYYNLYSSLKVGDHVSSPWRLQTIRKWKMGRFTFSVLYPKITF